MKREFREQRELREQRADVVVFFSRYNVGVCERGFLGQERPHLHHGRSVSACVLAKKNVTLTLTSAHELKPTHPPIP